MFFFFKYIRLGLGFIESPNFHCIEEQTAKGTDHLQGQDRQNQLQVQPAGLRERMLHAQEEQECCVARRVNGEGQRLEVPCGPVDLGVAAAPDLPVVILDVAFKKQMQEPQDDFPKDYDCLNLQWVGVVFWAFVFTWIRVRTQHTC